MLTFLLLCFKFANKVNRKALGTPLVNLIKAEPEAHTLARPRHPRSPCEALEQATEPSRTWE